MPYEMQRYRLDLTLYNYDGVPFDDIESKLAQLFKWLATQNIYILRCLMGVSRLDNTEFDTILTFDNLGNYYFSNNIDEDLHDVLINNIAITLQYNENGISDEYIERYNKHFK